VLEIDQKRLLLKPNADIEVAAVNAGIAVPWACRRASHATPAWTTYVGIAL
jgi:hypothetical protein